MKPCRFLCPKKGTNITHLADAAETPFHPASRTTDGRAPAPVSGRDGLRAVAIAAGAVMAVLPLQSRAADQSAAESRPTARATSSNMSTGGSPLRANAGKSRDA